MAVVVDGGGGATIAPSGSYICRELPTSPRRSAKWFLAALICVIIYRVPRHHHGSGYYSAWHHWCRDHYSARLINADTAETASRKAFILIIDRQGMRRMSDN